MGKARIGRPYHIDYPGLHKTVWSVGLQARDTHSKLFLSLTTQTLTHTEERKVFS